MLRQLIGQPVQTLVQTGTLSGTGGLDVPSSVAEAVQTQFVGEFTDDHRVWKILFVRKNQKNRLLQLLLLHHLSELLSRLCYSLSVVAVHHEDQTLCVLEVVSPQRTDLVLTADVPHCETDVLVLHRLHIKTDSRDGGDDLSELQFV